MRSRSRTLAAVVLTLATAAFLACGSRTALPYDEEQTASTADTGGDGPKHLDGGDDAIDEDALPLIDVRPPRDVDRTDCPDADSTLVYLVTTNNELLSFYPPTAAFRRIGVIACPAPSGTTPFSMAVDRKGVAYVLFNDGHLYRVSTSTAACVGTNFQVDQHGFQTFGMGYAANNLSGGPTTETLFVASDEGTAFTGGRLGSINTSTFSLGVVGTFNPPVTRAELTGTGAGDLFAFYADTLSGGTGDSFIGQIDKQTAAVVAADRLAGLDQGQGWAFAFWGGDFYMFTAPQATSKVTRYRPTDKTLTPVTTYPGLIVGAGVSTCAPQ